MPVELRKAELILCCDDCSLRAGWCEFSAAECMRKAKQDGWQFTVPKNVLKKPDKGAKCPNCAKRRGW